MTEQEAIKILNTLLDVPDEIAFKYSSVITDEQRKALADIREVETMSIKALEKQIAKKPYIEESAGFKLYHCPGCEMPIFAGTEYCSDCGQKLLWKWGE